MTNAFDRLLEQNAEKHHVVISRHWSNPKIMITVNKDKIELVTTLDEFINSLVSEIDNKKLVISTKKKMDKKLKDAAKQVILKIQESTNQVM